MIAKTFDYLLHKYDEENFVLQQKAKVMLAILFAWQVLIVVLLISAFFQNDFEDPGVLIPLIGALIGTYFIIFMLKKGWFSASANAVIICLTVVIWTSIFAETGPILVKLDTVCVLVGLLSISPLIVPNNQSGKISIFIHFMVNIIILAVFCYVINDQMLVKPAEVMEYFVDCSIGLVSLGVVSYQIFSISKSALDRASTEIETNKELNRTLEQKVFDRTEELKSSNKALKESESKISSFLLNSPDYIFIIDHDFIIQYANRSGAGYATENITGNDAFSFLPLEYHDQFRRAFVQTFKTGSSDIMEVNMVLPNGEQKWIENRFAAIRDDTTISEIMLIATDISMRKKTEKKFKTAQKELLAQAHLAGMAEIATGILHNVGNILNSLKVSAQLIQEVLRKSSIDGFKNANQLLNEHADNLNDFFRHNPKGKKLLLYYQTLEEKFEGDNNKIISYMSRLFDKIQEISDVVAAQQDYAGAPSFLEELDVSVIIDSVLVIESEIMEESYISVEKEYTNVPKIVAQKTKFLHILVNLFKNARNAMTESSSKKLSVRVDCNDRTVFIRVKDTGMGIPQKDITKIFAYGYTTMKDGLGFGLHNCANYMTEMGGKIWAESDGKGEGATFVLEFPLRPI